MRQKLTHEFGGDGAADRGDRVARVVEIREALYVGRALLLGRERKSALGVRLAEVHVQRAVRPDREARGDHVDLAGLERGDQATEVVGQDLDLEAHVGRKALRDVDLEADQVAARRARGPWHVERDADSQRAAEQHLLQRARRSGVRRRSCEQRR